MHKVHIVGYDGSVYRVFAENGWTICKNMEDADFICLTGGADINPEIYGQFAHRTTSFIPHRDVFEISAYKKARELGKKVLGICRGAQLMNALEGGDMYQHVNNHYDHHRFVDLVTGEERITNSIHHQMMIPASNGEVIAVARGHSDRREKMNGAMLHADYGVHDDPEVIMFKDSSESYFGLGFQGHPEYGHPPTTQYFFQLIDRYLV